jgi:hypothetical protein
MEKRNKYSESRKLNRIGRNAKKDMLNISKSYDNHMENENVNVNVNSNVELMLYNVKPKKEKIIEKTLFDEFLDLNCPTVRKLKIQMTTEQAEKLADEFGVKACQDIFEAMENWVPLSKKSKSVYLTAKKWLSNRQQQTNNGKSKPTFTEAAMDWLNRTS